MSQEQQSEELSRLIQQLHILGYRSVEGGLGSILLYLQEAVTNLAELKHILQTLGSNLPEAATSPVCRSITRFTG